MNYFPYVPFQFINILRYLADAIVSHVEVFQVPEVGEEVVGQRLDQVVAGGQLGQALAVPGEVQRRVYLPHTLTCMRVRLEIREINGGPSGIGPDMRLIKTVTEKKENGF